MRKISIIIPSAPDRSTDDILANLKEICPSDLLMEVIVVKGSWPPLQRNMAIEKAAGDIIFLFDDDIIVPKGAIEKALEVFAENPEVQIVGGPNLTPPTDSFWQHCFGETLASYFVAFHTAVRYFPAKNLKKVQGDHLISCNLAFRAKILKENLFDPQVFPNEENELMARISRKGNRLCYEPAFFVYHHRRKTLGKFMQQVFKWGVGRTIHTLKRPAHFSISFFVPIGFLFYIMSLLLIIISGNILPFWYLLPLAVYLMLDIFFVLYSSLRAKNVGMVFVLLWLFPLIHIVYSLGLLWGFGRFSDKNFQKYTVADFKMTVLEITK